MSRPELIVSGLADIADGLCRVLTLGFWCPYLSMAWCCWCTLRACARKQTGGGNE